MNNWEYVTKEEFDEPRDETRFCRNCGKKLEYTLDEWGHTPFHLHCNNCTINIGATNIKDLIELHKTYHEPNTYIEYYKNQIQLLIRNNEIEINNERI